MWFNLANAYLKLGKKEEAIAALKQTLALNPDVTAARCVALHCAHVTRAGTKEDSLTCHASLFVAGTCCCP